VERGGQAVARLLRLNPNDQDANAVVAELQWRLAAWQRHSGRPAAAKAAIERGLAAVETILAVNPRHARALALRGGLQREQAERAGGAQRAELLAHARASLEQALAINRFLSREYGTVH
jgi:hypothetical protein